MAHEIETMAYANEVPWHKLGTQVAEDLTPAEMQKAAQLDWTVVSDQLILLLIQSITKRLG